MELKSILYCALWPIICSCGMGGNILTLVVLFRVNDSSTALQYLKSLAVADILTIAINIAYIPFMVCQLFWPEEYLSWAVKSYSILQLYLSAGKISKCIIVAIVFDRVVAVTWPFRYKAICTPVRTTAAIVIIFMLIIATTTPYIVNTFMYGFKTDGNRTIGPSAQSEAGHFMVYYIHTTKWLPAHIFVNRLLFDLIPIPLVIAGNIVIIIGLRKAGAVKSTPDDASNQRKYQDRQLTKLLLFLSFSFLVLCAPFDLLGLFTLINSSQKIVPLGFFLQEIFRTLTLINSSINFVIYAVMNKRYRQGYMSILVCCRGDAGQDSLQGGRRQGKHKSWEQPRNTGIWLQATHTASAYSLHNPCNMPYVWARFYNTNVYV